MPTATIDVDTDTYVDAGTAFLTANDAACDLVSAAATAAGAGGGMAGTDSGGVDWASSYDTAAASALTAGATLADSLGHLGELLSLTGANHADADASSTPGGPPVYPGGGDVPAAVSVIPATPPSANGTDDDPPPGWFLVAHLLQYVWPNGHQDRLRSVASGWNDGATRLTEVADRLSGPIGDVSAVQSPEVEAAVATCCEVQQSARSLAELYTSLGTSCSDYATHLDDAHGQVIDELVQFAAESAGLQIIAAVAAPVTAGASELAGQAAQAARTALAASRIGRILQKLIDVVRTVTAAVRAVATRLGDVLTKLRAVLAKGGAKAVETASHLPALSRLRKVSAPLRQLELKYKHAAAFGVSLPRGRAGFDAFGKAIEAFVRNPSTIRVFRTYRNQPAVLNYDMNSMLAVVQTPDGVFVTGWKMSLEQFRNVLAGRPLSGG